VTKKRVRSKLEVEQDIAKLKELQDNVIREWRPLQKKLDGIYKKMRGLEEELSAAEVAAMDAAGQVDWGYLIRNGNTDRGGMALYKRAQREFDGLGFMMSGRWADSNETAVQLQMYRDDPTSYDQTLSAIQTVLPHYTPGATGFVRFGIFEHTLSEGGVYQLEITPDMTLARLTKTVYGSERLVFEGTGEDVLRRIQRDHYYQKKRGGWDSDD
jgi:hypothetical protein